MGEGGMQTMDLHIETNIHPSIFMVLSRNTRTYNLNSGSHITRFLAVNAKTEKFRANCFGTSKHSVLTVDEKTT